MIDCSVKEAREQKLCQAPPTNTAAVKQINREESWLLSGGSFKNACPHRPNIIKWMKPGMGQCWTIWSRIRLKVAPYVWLCPGIDGNEQNEGKQMAWKEYSARLKANELSLNKCSILTTFLHEPNKTVLILLVESRKRDQKQNLHLEVMLYFQVTDMKFDTYQEFCLIQHWIVFKCHLFNLSILEINQKLFAPVDCYKVRWYFRAQWKLT